MEATTMTRVDRSELRRRLARRWGTRVARARRRQGLSQQALADRCAVSQQTISKVERGEVLPGDGLKLVLAAAVGVPPGELFSWPGELTLKPRAGVRSRPGGD